jgi:hypothetical protein
VADLEARRDLSVRQLAAWLDSDEAEWDGQDEWEDRTLRLPLQGPPRGALRHMEADHSLHSSLFTLVFDAPPVVCILPNAWFLACLH